MQNLVNAMIDRVGVETIELRLHQVEPLLQTGHLGRIRLAGDRRGKLGRLVLQCDEGGQSLSRFVQHRPLARIVGFLLQESDVGRAVPRHFAPIGLIEARENTHQRGFARTIGTDRPTCSPGRISRLTPCKTGAASICRKISWSESKIIDRLPPHPIRPSAPTSSREDSRRAAAILLHLT